MNYLLDTHIFLWMLADPARLNEKATKIIQNPNKSVYVSAVTAVEIAIKKKLRKLDAPDGLGAEIRSRGLLELPLRYTHGEAMQNLPDHHSDPFDRMLIAQAQCEGFTIITHDGKFENYPVEILWT
jgi:PIN domain nuclease of toxin-antitoxin system